MARRGVFDTILDKEEYMQPGQVAVPIKLPDATTQDPDELIECPYDKIHRIRISRFPMHLLKCRKNYTGKEMFTCPFNARHLVPAPEARHHVANCPDKAAIEKDMLQGLELNNAYCRGYTKVPSYSRQEYHHKPTENWDEEICRVTPMEQRREQEEAETSGGHGLPRPRGRGAPRAVGTNQPEMRLPRQPAQAAAVAQQRHQQLQNPHAQVNGYAKPAPASVPAPAPTPAPVQAQPTMKVAGLGRGQFKGRVMAANLWGAQTQEGALPNGQPSPPRPGGLGQSTWGAQPDVPAQNGPTMPPSLADDDFPPLGAPNPSSAGLGRGLGRGMLLNPAPGLRPTVGMQNGTM